MTLLVQCLQYLPAAGSDTQLRKRGNVHYNGCYNIHHTWWQRYLVIEKHIQNWKFSL